MLSHNMVYFKKITSIIKADLGEPFKYIGNTLGGILLSYIYIHIYISSIQRGLVWEPPHTIFNSGGRTQLSRNFVLWTSMWTRLRAQLHDTSPYSLR